MTVTMAELAAYWAFPSARAAAAFARRHCAWLIDHDAAGTPLIDLREFNAACVRPVERIRR